MTRPDYLVGSSKVPSVTEVIGSNLGWDKQALIAWARREGMAGRDPYLLRDKAASIGTLTHLLIQQRNAPDKVTIDWKTWTPEHRALAETGLAAFERWAKPRKIETLDTEKSLVSARHHYGGTLDWIANIDEIPSYLDFKTSKGIYPGHKIQVAAYLQLWHENYGVWLQPNILHLKKDDGTFTHHILSDLQPYLQVFLCLLEIHSLRSRIEHPPFPERAGKEK